MALHHYHRFLHIHRCSSNEFHVTYREPQPFLYFEEKALDRNNNTLGSTLLSRQLKLKPKKLLRLHRILKDLCTHDKPISKGAMINKILSTKASDYEAEYYMLNEPTITNQQHCSLLMADGDKRYAGIHRNFSDELQQQRFKNHQNRVNNRIQNNTVRSIPRKPNSNNVLKGSSAFNNTVSHLVSSRETKSTLESNRISTWRRLRANVTPFHYNNIQNFERQCRKQNHPLSTIDSILLPSLYKVSVIHSSSVLKVEPNMMSSSVSYTSLAIDSCTYLSDASDAQSTIKSIDSDRQISKNDEYSHAMMPATCLCQAAYLLETYSTNKIQIENNSKCLDLQILKFPSTVFNNETKKNYSCPDLSIQISLRTPSLHETKNIEEFQTFIESAGSQKSRYIILHNALTLFSPNTLVRWIFPSSNKNNLGVSSQYPVIDNTIEKAYLLYDNAENITRILNCKPSSSSSPSSLTDVSLTAGDYQSKQFYSLSESLEHLCILIRKLVQCQSSERNTTALQITIINQLSILLSYLAILNAGKINFECKTKDTAEKLISTDDDLFCGLQQSMISTTGIQTDVKWIIQTNDPTSKNLFEFSKSSIVDVEPTNHTVDFVLHKHESLTLQPLREGIIDGFLSSQEVSHRTELIPTSITLALPGRRPSRVLSDTSMYRISHRQTYKSSYHRFNSFSETILCSLKHHFDYHRIKRAATEQLSHCIGQRFHYFIELESSNTCLEASTEFTPDFLSTIINNSKYDDDNVRTESFAIGFDEPDYQTDTMSLVVNEQDEKTDTLTFSSIEKENHHNLNLDFEQDFQQQPQFMSTNIHQSSRFSMSSLNIGHDGIPKHSRIELNNLVLDNSTVDLFDDPFTFFLANQVTNRDCYYQLLEPLLNISQWYLPTLPRKLNSADMMYEKQIARIFSNDLKVHSNSSSRKKLVGKQVRIRANVSQTSKGTIEEFLNL